MDIGAQILLWTVGIIVLLLIWQAFRLTRSQGSVEGVSVPADRVTQEIAGSARDLEQEVQKHIPEDPRKASAVTKAISSYVVKEVEKKTRQKTAEIQLRFEREIEEKNKKIDVAVQQVKVIGEKYEQLDLSYKELGEEKKQTEEIVHSMAEGVIMVNKQGEVLLMNPAAERLLGVKKEEKIGKPLTSDLKEEQLVSMVQQPADRAKSKEIVIQSQNDQVKKVLLASNAVIESEDGKTVGFVSVISDVTKQKELEELKNEFLTNVSHDLRSPITALRGALELLSDPASDPLTPGQQKYVSMAVRNIDRLSRLINDLLDISKLESKKFSIAPAPFAIDDLVHSLVHEFEAWGKTKGITIRTEIEKPLELEADKDRIGQVLTNLISNALKFTPNGGTVIVAGRRAPDKQRIELGVRDTGPGIAEKDFPKIFEKFSRLESRAVRGVSGTGLGLTIAKEIVELHGGRIWVESKEGEGSYFAFELPVKTALVGPRSDETGPSSTT